MSDIVIDLDNHETDAKPVGNEQLFQQEGRKRVEVLISRFVADAEKLGTKGSGGANNAQYETVHVHNTIMINGSRGSGKTMFIVNLLESLKSTNDIQIARILDPTLIDWCF
jgi:hypothetical protein